MLDISLYRLPFAVAMRLQAVIAVTHHLRVPVQGSQLLPWGLGAHRTGSLFGPEVWGAECILTSLPLDSGPILLDESDLLAGFCF